jgi:hypothetical protein
MAADLAGEALAACCGPAVHLWRPAAGAEHAAAAATAAVQFAGRALEPPAAPLAAAWNRNNKVVAAALADGRVELRYGGGDAMALLPRGGAPPAPAPLTSLAWGLGSRRLAAGCADGSVRVHDMTTKESAAVRAAAPGAGGVAGVAWHPEDAFLAAAAGAGVALFSRHLVRVGALGSAGGGAASALALAGGGARVAAGCAEGGVALWDAGAQALLTRGAGRHAGAGGVGGLAFGGAAFPDLLLSAGAGDGCVFGSDLRAGDLSGRPAWRAAAGGALASLAAREDGALLAAGTAAGEVLLWDPRRPGAPAARLRCGAGPVTGLHWQHRYSSAGAAGRAAAAFAAAAAAEAAAEAQAEEAHTRRRLDASPPPPALAAELSAESLDGAPPAMAASPAPPPARAYAAAPPRAASPPPPPADGRWSIKAAGAHDAAGPSSVPAPAPPAPRPPSAKTPLAPVAKPAPASPLDGAAAHAHTAAGAPGGGAAGTREDVLALHLDMLDQFAAQAARTSELVAGLAAGQAALAEEVAALRRQLAGLTARHDEALWI